MRRGLIALMGLLLAGCQAPGLSHSSFVLASLGGDATPVASTAMATSGQITVNFSSVLPKARRLQARRAWRSPACSQAR